MVKSLYRKTITVLLTIFFIFNSGIISILATKSVDDQYLYYFPDMGSFAEYIGYMYTLTSTNLSLIYDYDEANFLMILFKWEVVDVEESSIYIKTSIRVVLNDSNRPDYGYIINDSQIFVISKSNYDLYDLDNHYIGKFLLVGPVFVNDKDSINLPLYKDIVFGNVTVLDGILGSVVEISHLESEWGFQKIYTVRWRWSIMIKYTSDSTSIIDEISYYKYDYDTGIAVEIDISDFIFRYFGIFENTVPLTLINTNIHLGPSDIGYLYYKLILSYFVVSTPFILFVLAVVIIIILRRRKKKVFEYGTNKN